MSLDKIGELGIIEKLRHIAKGRSKKIKIGIGDDCAVIGNSELDTLVTTDTLIENVHFNLSYFPPVALGEKAIAVNLSDIAAMGGVPLYILISLGIPASTQVEFVEELYVGFENMAKKYNCSIIGGDTVKSESALMISVTIIGEAKKNASLSRAGAKNKDKIFITGVLGDSAAALDLLEKSGTTKNEIIERHLSPTPRLEEGQRLAGDIGASAMIDLSDGLVSDLQRICDESQCGARIYLDKIPLSKCLREWGKLSKKNVLDYALYGGEDYELLFTIDENRIQSLEKIWQNMKTPITCIGEIDKKRKGIALVYEDGKEEPPAKGGYDHFLLSEGKK
jgi:thiamine-monophosphate kinase